jgi:hypothetical protein
VKALGIVVVIIVEAISKVMILLFVRNYNHVEALAAEEEDSCIAVIHVMPREHIAYTCYSRTQTLAHKGMFAADSVKISIPLSQ